MKAKLAMFDKDYSKYLPSVYNDDGSIVSVDEWKSGMGQIMINKEAFLGSDGSLYLYGCNNIIDNLIKVETNCIKFVSDIKGINDSRWDLQIKLLQEFQGYN